MASVTARPRTVPPHVYFVVSAFFHYLGPSFAVLLFARVEPLGVAWLRIASAAVIFAVWRRPWRVVGKLERDTRRTLLAWGAVLAVMNCCFYEAIDRLPLSTVAAIEFLPVIGLAAVGMRTARNALALVIAVGGVYVLVHPKLAADPLGLGFAFANAALFAAYIVLAHRAARDPALSGIDALAGAMIIASLAVTPFAAGQTIPAFTQPTALLAGVGVGISSSVLPYVTDQLAMARLARATYSLMVALLPALATLTGLVVLAQVPSPADALGIACVIFGVALHREHT
jgi:inner membrane transporter RhtA